MFFSLDIKILLLEIYCKEAEIRSKMVNEKAYSNMTPNTNVGNNPNAPKARTDGMNHDVSTGGYDASIKKHVFKEHRKSVQNRSSRQTL